VLFSHVSTHLMLSCNHCFPPFIIFSHSPSRKMGRNFTQFFQVLLQKAHTAQHFHEHSSLYMYTTYSSVDTITAPTETNAGEGELIYSSGRVS